MNQTLAAANKTRQNDDREAKLLFFEGDILPKGRLRLVMAGYLSLQCVNFKDGGVPEKLDTFVKKYYEEKKKEKGWNGDRAKFQDRKGEWQVSPPVCNMTRQEEDAFNNHYFELIK